MENQNSRAARHFVRDTFPGEAFVGEVLVRSTLATRVVAAAINVRRLFHRFTLDTAIFLRGGAGAIGVRALL